MEQSYKEKYEQALMVAKETYDEQPMYRDWLEKMFPELKESEDEKVRKELIKETKGSEVRLFETVTNDEFVAWLENFPYTIDHEKREGFHLGYRAGFEKQSEQKPTDEDMKTLLRTEYEKGRADAIAEIQKGWSEEDEKILRTILSDGIRGVELDMLQVNWLKSLRPQNHWKPSDKHIRFLQAMVNDPNNASSESCQIVLKDILEKLKKLKEE